MAVSKTSESRSSTERRWLFGTNVLVMTHFSAIRIHSAMAGSMTAGTLNAMLRSVSALKGIQLSI